MNKSSFSINSVIDCKQFVSVILFNFTKFHKPLVPSTQRLWTIGVGLRMSTLDSNVAGSIPASICFLLEQETLSALLQSTQL